MRLQDSSLIALAIWVLVEVLKESHTECSTGGPCSCVRGCVDGCVCAVCALRVPCVRGRLERPLSRIVALDHFMLYMAGHLERPLSRIVALGPSGRPFGATPVEDRSFPPFHHFLARPFGATPVEDRGFGPFHDPSNGALVDAKRSSNIKMELAPTPELHFGSQDLPFGAPRSQMCECITVLHPYFGGIWAQNAHLTYARASFWRLAYARAPFWHPSGPNGVLQSV